MTPFPQVFVLHVSSGYENRKKHIDALMHRLDLSFEYILDGDKDSLTPQIMDTFFDPDGELGKPAGATSCAYKHLLACQQIIDRHLPGAVILEDDVILTPRFTNVVKQSISELPDTPSIINYEDTRLRFVPRSMRKKGKVLYPGDRDRFTAALYINRKAAQTILDTARKERLSVPIDIFHRQLLDRGLIDYWWTHPCVASQGSFSGLFSSAIDKSKGSILKWKLKKAYRRLLYWFR